VWFEVNRMIQHKTTLVVHGNGGGIACYRNGIRAWGVTGVKSDPTAALLFTLHPFTTDAHGRPVKPAGTFRCTDATALVLGPAVAEIDRTDED